MKQRDMLIDEIKKAPDEIFQQVYDFYQFLKLKSDTGKENFIASESSLKKEWLREEEDEAWKDL